MAHIDGLVLDVGSFIVDQIQDFVLLLQLFSLILLDLLIAHCGVLLVVGERLGFGLLKDCVFLVWIEFVLVNSQIVLYGIDEIPPAHKLGFLELNSVLVNPLLQIGEFLACELDKYRGF